MITATALHGCSLIDGTWIPGTNGEITGFDPRTNARLEPSYSLASSAQLRKATTAAKRAFQSYRLTSPELRADFLNSIADNIDALTEEIVQRASLETGLTPARLTGEVARTSNQLRLFATTVKSGEFHRVRIERGPRVDLRQRHIPLGPVAVFGASNFPLAFSTAGGDTASALAAGCPVVFKAHNAHPGTAELVGQAVLGAVEKHGLDAGVFNLVYGRGVEIGQELAADPAIQAIGFTGSRQGGLALMHTAFNRPVPVPVFAEMSATNPVFVFPGALADLESSTSLAAAFTASITGSSGQLCTKPGLVFVPRGVAGDAFVQLVASEFAGTTGQTMLTKGIAEAWQRGVDNLEKQPGVGIRAHGKPGAGENAPGPVVFESDIQTLLNNAVLQEEIFGAASLIVRYDSPEQLHEAALVLEGQLTATIHSSQDDFGEVTQLIPLLEDLAGRILFGGWPTGVEVGHAVIHGGPFPATSNAQSTSVGTLAIERFMRPISYQSFPAELLPDPVSDPNKWAVPREIDR
ncbi:ketoglutarate semialdehyde dehydrogenase [Corynebacterium suranareeae]|uniref:Ketoglutarate semialdehyde dehydrogenase n=1 Tax=Corynebacterium suranareeae TaxID=2506452 RepID=A0A160PNB8_9CORY|nr:aldehyde dehydrogenase (NADP(+)) [Corynebacterium suranareeae]BAU94856.1 ketoglutarate semialdehyde dehydrogenase [Corynebacterium suranareeae]